MVGESPYMVLDTGGSLWSPGHCWSPSVQAAGCLEGEAEPSLSVRVSAPTRDLHLLRAMRGADGGTGTSGSWDWGQPALPTDKPCPLHIAEWPWLCQPPPLSMTLCGPPPQRLGSPLLGALTGLTSHLTLGKSFALAGPQRPPLQVEGWP